MSFFRPKLLSVMIILLSLSILAAVGITPQVVSNSNLIEDKDILAEYDGGIIVRKDIMDKISKLPPAYQGRLMTIEGQLQVLQNVATEEVFYLKAKEMGLHEGEVVLEKLNDLERSFYLQEYYRVNVSEKVVTTEKELETYYNLNLDQYFVAPNITIHYLQAEDEESALAAKEELDAGAAFAEVSDKYNQNTYSRGLKGVVRYVRLTGNIPGLGNDYELEDIIRTLEVDEEVTHGPYHTEYGWHILRVVDKIEGRQKSFLEVREDLEKKVNVQNAQKLTDEVRAQLKEKYEAVIDEELLAQVDLHNTAANEGIVYMVLVNSPHDEVIMTVQDLIIYSNNLSPQEQIYYLKGPGVEAMLEQALIQNLIYIDARDNGYDKYFKDTYDYLTISKNIIIRSAYEALVLNDLEVSDEEIEEYYEAKKESFATPAKRSIQVLFFNDRKEADKVWRKFRRAHKKKNEKTMAKLVKKHSLKPDKSIYDNIYNNAIITGLVQDMDFSRRIWDNEVGYLSPVFTAANEDIVFFRTLSEVEKKYKTALEVGPQIYGEIKKNKESNTLENVSEELKVEFNMKLYPERIRLTLTPEQLFEYADNAARNRNYKDAIRFYDQIILSYQNGDDDYKASFMKAFLIAEEMGETDRALELFQEFLEKYPEGDLHDSVEYMIDTLSGNADILEFLED